MEIAKIQSTLQHLSRLNSSLLLLTKIESNQFHDTEEVNIGELIRGKISDLQDIFENRNISTLIEEEQPLVVKMNRSLAEIATMNLLKNAFVHNIIGGVIRVKISTNGWSVSNSGADAPLDETRVFTRFYQTQKREGSTGLGLAITASVARLYGFEAKYSFCDGLHKFSVLKS